MVPCQNCGHDLQIDVVTEVTPDWNYRTQCECCGQEQYGVLYFGVFYPSPEPVPKSESP